MMRALDLGSSFAASVARGGLGMQVGTLGRRPECLLELYDFEGCPYCRKVREALSILDLDVLVYPCPKGGTVHRAAAEHCGGKQQFPYLVDPNAGVDLYESDAIIRHLFDRYGDGRVPLALALGPLGDGLSALTSGLRLGAGVAAAPGTPARAAARALLVRSLALLPPGAREAHQPRAALPAAQRRQGQPQARRLRGARGQDDGALPGRPQHGIAMFESADITAYLERTYGDGERA